MRSAVLSGLSLFHVGMRCIPAHSERVGHAHGPLFLFPPSVQMPYLFTFFAVSSIIHSSSKELRRGNTLVVVFGIFCSRGDTMAHSRARSKVWLWRAVTWPLAHLSTLFELAREARSNRVAGKLELKVVLIGLFGRPLRCAVSVV